MAQVLLQSSSNHDLGNNNMRFSIVPLMLALTATTMVSVPAMAHEVAGQQQYNVVSLQASASRQISNDQMQATLSIEKTHKQPSELANQINQLMNFAMTTAKKYPTVKIKTGSQHTSPIYDDNHRKIKEWRSQSSVILESRDFGAASKLVAELQQQFQLNGVSFSISDEQRQKVENELLTEVSQAFRNRADTIRQAWNKSSYELMSFNIDTQNAYYAAPMMAMSRSLKVMDASSVETQEVSAGESKITINAHGNVQLK